MSEIEQAFEVVEAGNCTDFWLGSYSFYRTLTCPKLGGEQNLEVVEIWRSSGGFRPRRSWKLHALCFSFAFAPQNHSRQHRKTKVSELYLSDCHQADFGDEMFRFAEFLKHFSGSLASCRDRPLSNEEFN